MVAQSKDLKTTPAPRFALSVDVEDYFQVWAFSNVISRSSWERFPLRVGNATRACLDMFDRHNARATFFVLGWVAERDPGLIREIVARGHELASHGFDHTKVTDQHRTEFKEDARRSKQLLEDIAGVSVNGYRAAGFSIDATTPWAHETLAEVGYLYSSSAHPIAHDHYGDENGPQTPYRPVAGMDLIEAPVATTELFGRRVSCAGGGWFRASPFALSSRLIARAAKRNDGPVVFYFHPWEIDADQPRIKAASQKSKLRHYLNIKSMAGKLDRLLARWPWARIDVALGLNSSESDEYLEKTSSTNFDGTRIEQPESDPCSAGKAETLS